MKKQRIKTKKLPTPIMTAEEFKRRVDYQVGDIVQIMQGEYAGRCAVIMNIGAYTYNGRSFLNYDLKLSDRVGVRATGPRLKLVRHGDDAEI